MTKHKMTGCARMFIALLIIAPLAYLGAAYYNGQNGIENIKHLLGISQHKESDNSSNSETYRGTQNDLQKSLDDKDKEILKLRETNESLQRENDDLRKELDKLKAQQAPQQ